MCPFPAVVRPEVTHRIPSNTLFQHAEISIGQFVILRLFRISGDEFERCLVIASAHTMHIKVEDGVPCPSRQALGTRQHRGIVIQEVEPMVDIIPEWDLV